jgi:hypothetical protein
MRAGRHMAILGFRRNAAYKTLRCRPCAVQAQEIMDPSSRNGDFVSREFMGMAMIRLREHPRMRALCAASAFWQRIRRDLVESLYDPYRPERHYMRGPGPKYRAKALLATKRQQRPFM